MTTANSIIVLNEVSKVFDAGFATQSTLLSRLVDYFPSGQRRHQPNKLTALRDVSFTVNRGDVLGIIGRNGSGKTTLLRLIADILKPDSGTVTVNGRVTSLINLSVGLQPRLTVHDNIFLTGALYGLSRSQCRAVFDDIVEFGELQEYVYRYVYQLSSGYIQRLAFSIAMFSNPEILLLDEVFSAGDEHFQCKATERLRSIMQRDDVTVLFVSHKTKHIIELCNRALWLERGAINTVGEPQAVVTAYEHSVVHH